MEKHENEIMFPEKPLTPVEYHRKNFDSDSLAHSPQWRLVGPNCWLVNVPLLSFLFQAFKKLRGQISEYFGESLCSECQIATVTKSETDLCGGSFCLNCSVERLTPEQARLAIWCTNCGVEEREAPHAFCGGDQCLNDEEMKFVQMNEPVGTYDNKYSGVNVSTKTVHGGPNNIGNDLWFRIKDRTSDDFYYFNATTQQATWEVPEGKVLLKTKKLYICMYIYIHGYLPCLNPVHPFHVFVTLSNLVYIFNPFFFCMPIIMHCLESQQSFMKSVGMIS